MNDELRFPVRFGGRARELWTDSGLCVSYSGGVELEAVFCAEVPGGWLASAPNPAHAGDVKADMAEYSRALELACRINDGGVPPLTLAYFRASASARRNLAGGAPPPEGALPILPVTDGLYDALILPETLRLMLDEGGLGWEEAASAVAGSFVYLPDMPVRPERALYRETAPLSAVAALQPRLSGLIRAVNEKLCERLWRAFPGDWLRIGSAAVLRDGEIDFPTLCAVMCGRTECSEELLSGRLRTLYTIMPEKFEETEI